MNALIANNPIRDWWRRHAIATVDHLAVIQRINDDAGWSPRYIFMTLMSAGIAILGLILSSPAVVIGAMLISPLMGPIIGFGFGLARFDITEIKESLSALALGSISAVLFTALIVVASPLQNITSEIAARTRPNLFDLMVALFSALAGSYAMIRGRSGTIVGVAIATALMPPLAVVGFGLATLNGTVFGGALFLFITNFITIALSAAIMARLYGFRTHLSPRYTQLQGFLMIATFVVLAVPLGLSLKQIAWETVASRQIRDVISSQFGAQARVSQLDIDYGRKPLKVSATVLTTQYAKTAQQTAAATLTRLLGRPVEVDLDQFRVGTAAGDAEAAQLAAAQANARAVAEDRRIARIAEQLSLVAGVSPDLVTLDPAHQRAIVAAAPLPGATFATYRELEHRVAAQLDGWSVSLVPPTGPLPSIAIKDGKPDADTIQTAVWAAQRIHMPIGVAARQKDRANEIVELLNGSGVVAQGMPRRPPRSDVVELSWLPLGSSQ